MEKQEHRNKPDRPGVGRPNRDNDLLQEQTGNSAVPERLDSKDPRYIPVPDKTQDQGNWST